MTPTGIDRIAAWVVERGLAGGSEVSTCWMASATAAGTALLGVGRAREQFTLDPGLL